MPDEQLVPLVAARLEEDGIAKAGADGAEFVAYATQVRFGEGVGCVRGCERWIDSGWEGGSDWLG